MNTLSGQTTALYVRVSTADQRTDSQTEELRVFCQARGYAKARLFVERESGAKVTRPQLDAMMSEIRTGKGGQGGVLPAELGGEGRRLCSGS